MAGTDALISYFSAFAIDGLIFVVLFSIFAFYRKIRTKKMNPPKDMHVPPDPPIEESKLTFLEILSTSYFFTDD